MPDERKSWDLDQLSATGRRFMRSPESRSGILQELQLKLRREQQRQEDQQRLLRSGNNATEDGGGLARDSPETYPASKVTNTANTGALKDSAEDERIAKTSPPLPPPPPPSPPPPPPPLAPKPSITRTNSTARQPGGSLPKKDESGTASRQQSTTCQRPSLTSQVFEEIMKHHSDRKLSTQDDAESQPTSYVFQSTTKNIDETNASEQRHGNFDSSSRLQQLQEQQAKRRTPSNITMGRSTPRLSSYDVFLALRASQQNLESLETTQASTSTSHSGLAAATQTNEIGTESNAALSASFDSRASIRSSSFDAGQPPAPPPPTPRLSPTPPCLQCLMHSLHDSGLLGSCWVTSVLELEEAFAIKAVADAAVSLQTNEALSQSYQQQQQQLMQSGSPNYYGLAGDPMSMMGAQKPQDVNMSKWQALERLCNFRNSLKFCSHVTVDD